MPRYSLNARDLVAKTIEDETVLINLASGVYYSTAGAGAVALAQLAAGGEPDEVARELALAYGADPVAVQADVERFVASLVEQGVLVSGASQADAVVDAPPADGEYAPPELEVYTDMGDLLALDPPMPGLQDIPWEAPPR